MEYEGGLPRTDTERAAMRLILSRRTRQGIDALEAALSAGIPLKPFYAKSADGDPASYSLALPLQHGDRYKAHLRGWLVLDVDRNHRDGADGLKTFIACLARLRKNGQALPSYLEAVLQSGGVPGFPCYAETPGGGWHLYFRHTGAEVSGRFGAGVEYKTQSITAAGSYKTASRISYTETTLARRPYRILSCQSQNRLAQRHRRRVRMRWLVFVFIPPPR